MEVFGFGTEEGIRPLLPPGTCWICENSPQQEAMKVIDTRRNSRPEKTGISERKYICEPCAREMGGAVGMVSAEAHEAINSISESRRVSLNETLDALHTAEAQQTRVVNVDDVLRVIRQESLTPPSTVVEPEDTGDAAP